MLLRQSLKAGGLKAGVIKLSYDPADLKLPRWLLRFLDLFISIRIVLWPGWRLGFTRPGMIFTAALIGVWAAAFYSGNNLLYLCGAMITAVMISSILQTSRLLRGMPDPLHCLPQLECGNNQVLRQSLPLPVTASAMVDMTIEYDGGEIAIHARCEGKMMRLEGCMQMPQRGVFRCWHLRLITAAPLGLFTLEAVRKSEGELIVLPQPLAWQGIEMAGRDAVTDRLTGGDEWFDLRQYQPGDALSRVHWRKASADMRDWKVKRFTSDAEEASQHSLLRVDLRLPAGFDDEAFERHLGRVWFWIKQQRGHGSLMLGQHYFELDREDQQLVMLRAIAAARPESEPPAGEGGVLLAVNCAD